MICKFQKAKNEMLHPSCETRILVEAEMPVSPSFEGNASQLCNRPDHPALSGKPSIKLHCPPPLLINDCENISFSTFSLHSTTIFSSGRGRSSPESHPVEEVTSFLGRSYPAKKDLEE